MMYNRILLLIDVLLVLSVLCDLSTAAHEEGEGSFCSRNESGEMESGLDLQSLVSTCFGEAFASPVPYINICDSQGRLNCDSIRRVMSIVPSCHYCDYTATDRESCYIGQKRGANCSINYLLKKMFCVKSRGTCELQMFHESSQSLHDVTTMEETTIVLSEETTAATQYAEKHYYRDRDYEKYKKEDCAPCECSQTEKQTKVSVGVAVGLLFLGVVIGIIVTAVICICVPSLNRRASIFRGKITEKYKKSGSRDTTGQQRQDVDSSVADNTLPAESAITYPVLPTAPPASSIGSNQARYHTLDAMSNARNSHTYTGLQPDSSEYNEPMEGGNSYRSPESQPIKGANAVVSPVYQEFTDNVISSTGKNNINNTDNGPMRNSDTTDAANHTYFVLEAQNEASKENTIDNGRPLSEHQYFVLEEQNKQQAPSNITDNTDPEYHQYFVLEKGQI